MSLTASIREDIAIVPLKARVAAILDRTIFDRAMKPDPLFGRFGRDLSELVRLASRQIREDANERRQHRRIPTLLAGIIVAGGVEIARCRITDISESGARLALDGAAPIPEMFEIRLTGGRSLRARRVRATGLEFGIVFI